MNHASRSMANRKSNSQKTSENLRRLSPQNIHASSKATSQIESSSTASQIGSLPKKISSTESRRISRMSSSQSGKGSSSSPSSQVNQIASRLINRINNIQAR